MVKLTRIRFQILCVFDLKVAGKKFVYSFSPCAKNGMSVICLEISENKKNSIEKLTQILDAMPNSALKMDQQRRLLNLKLEYSMYEKFQKGYVTILGKDYPITIYRLEGDKVPYSCDMEIQC